MALKKWCGCWQAIVFFGAIYTLTRVFHPSNGRIQYYLPFIILQNTRMQNSFFPRVGVIIGIKWQRAKIFHDIEQLLFPRKISYLVIKCYKFFLKWAKISLSSNISKLKKYNFTYISFKLNCPTLSITKNLLLLVGIVGDIPMAGAY